MRRDLPSGTVTFLFTDVEGSTRLLHELGAEAYAEALAEHRRVIRKACSAHGGVEVDTQGDAFFFAFPTAPGALAAAADMSGSLAAGPIQVRIGLHTGSPLLAEEGYVGDAVHFAARVAASGHGGQVVVSRATRDLVDDSDLTNLGAHRLKDITEPVAIFQLGEGSFPPLKTIANTNLPTPVSRFLGREAELYDADLLLRDSRLLTITGPGGAGKTRFALELARRAREERFSDYSAGVFSCFFASLRDPALVLPTIAQTLAVGEEAGGSALEALAMHLEGKRMLLLLDNLEHLLNSAAQLSGLLERAPGLTLLVTSREVLRLRGESTYELPPLAEDEGVALFCERAAVEPSPPIAELCRRLDGLPLAIELAAARTRILTPAQLRERLSQRLDLLKGGRDSDPRQQTLRATIEWSYDLLSPGEQQLFARISVFAGGCTLEAAEEVADADLDTLQSLVEKSLLRFSDGRYWMLETIREFALEQLETIGEAETRKRRHAMWHARMAVELFPWFGGYHEEEASAILEREQANMRAGLEFAFERGDAAIAADFIAGLWLYWLPVGSGAEAAGWAGQYLAIREKLPPLERVLGDHGTGEILRWTGDREAAGKLKRELIEVGRSHPGFVVRTMSAARLTAVNLGDLAEMELDAGRITEARRAAEEALAIRREIGDPFGIGRALHTLASVVYTEGDFERAGRISGEAAAASDAAGSSRDVAGSRLMIAECLLLMGRFEECSALLREVIPVLARSPDSSITVLRLAGMLASVRDDPELCATLFGAVDRWLQESGVTIFGRAEQDNQMPYIGRARKALGDDTFSLAYERGGDISLEEACEVALAATG